MIAAVRAFELQKLAGGAAVLLLHLLVIAALLSTTNWTIRQIAQPREIILRLLAPKTAPKPEEKKVAPAKLPPTGKAAPAFVPPSTFEPPADNPVPQLNGLNRQLFGCTPDQLATATAEERAACASVSLGPRYDSAATDYRDHTGRSKDAALWARDRARKNAPLLLPCMNPQGFSPLYTLYCLGKSAVEGKVDTRAQLNYADKPEQIHIPNNGDPPSAPH